MEWLSVLLQDCTFCIPVSCTASSFKSNCNLYVLTPPRSSLHGTCFQGKENRSTWRLVLLILLPAISTFQNSKVTTLSKCASQISATNLCITVCRFDLRLTIIIMARVTAGKCVLTPSKSVTMTLPALHCAQFWKTLPKYLCSSIMITLLLY